MGFVDDVVKNKVLGGARALIYPTNWDEPCAGAPLELLPCGTPVISTKNGCMPEMVSVKSLVKRQVFFVKPIGELLEAPEKLKSVKPAAVSKTC